MLPKLLILFFVLICFTNSLFVFNRSPKFEDIMRSEGWKSITGMEINLPNETMVNVNELVTNNLSSIDENIASLILNRLYYDVLTYFKSSYRTMSREYRELQDNENKIDKFKKLINAIVKFKPLMSCMAKALNYFKNKSENSSNENNILEILKKLLEFTKKISNINIEQKYKNNPQKKYEFINDTCEKFYEIVNIILKFNTNAIIRLSVEEFFVEYMNDLRESDDVINAKMGFNSNRPDFEEKVQKGVTLFCVNFGFK